MKLIATARILNLWFIAHAVCSQRWSFRREWTVLFSILVK